MGRVWREDVELGVRMRCDVEMRSADAAMRSYRGAKKLKDDAGSRSLGEDEVAWRAVLWIADRCGVSRKA